MFLLISRQENRLHLVGPSGSGKTTICSLLPRFYDVTGGRITIDGKDVRKSDITRVFVRQIGLVQQDVYLFCWNVSVRILRMENRMLRWKRSLSAAKKANIHDFIMELPDGYDTFVGETWNQTVRWSETADFYCPRIFEESIYPDPG